MRRIVCAAAAAALAAASLPASAQPGAAVAARVVEISPWTAPDRPLEVRLRVSNQGAAPVGELQVRLEIFPRVLSRSQLRSSLDADPGGEPIALTTEDAPGHLVPGETRTVAVSRDPAQLATSFRPGGARAGVYPLRIEVRAANDTVATFRTAMIFFPTPPETRLNVVWVFPAHRPAAYAPNRTYGASAVAEMLDPDRLSGAVAEIAKRPSPVTFVPSSVLLDSLADLADGFRLRDPGDPVTVPATDARAKEAGRVLALLRQVAGATVVEVAAAPYARADLVALAHARLRAEVTRQVTRGRERAAARLGRAPAPGLLVPAGFRVDQRVAPTLAALGVRDLVLDPDALGVQPAGSLEAPLFGPSRPIVVSGPGDVSFRALLVDPDVRARLGAGDAADRVILAHNVLAETASAWHELPAVASERLLVIAPDRTPSPATTGALLAGFGQAPWLRLRTALDALAALPAQGEPVALSLEAPQPDPVLAAAAEARRAVDLVWRVLDGVTPLERLLDRYVLAAESIDWAEDPARGLAIARAARSDASSILGRIRAASRRVTLTARTGALPVTIVNETGLPVSLQVRLESSKVSFPKGASRLVRVEGRLHTLTFPVEARAAGAFPVDALLLTPDGKRVIGRGRVVVRSTAVSAVTLMATGAGALFLLAAWARRLRRSRKAA